MSRLLLTDQDIKDHAFRFAVKQIRIDYPVTATDYVKYYLDFVNEHYHDTDDLPDHSRIFWPWLKAQLELSTKSLKD